MGGLERTPPPARRRPAAPFAPPSPPADLVQLGEMSRRRQVVTPARYKDYEMEAVASGRGRRAVSSDFWSQPEGSVLEPQRSNGVRRHGESQELLTRLLGQAQEPGNEEGLQVGAGADLVLYSTGSRKELPRPCLNFWPSANL